MWKKQWIGQGKGLHVYILLFSCWLNHYSTRHMNCFWRGHNGASRLNRPSVLSCKCIYLPRLHGKLWLKRIQKSQHALCLPCSVAFWGFSAFSLVFRSETFEQIDWGQGPDLHTLNCLAMKKKKNLIDCFGCVCVRVGLLSCCAGLKLGTTLNLKWSRVWGLKAAAQWHNDLTTRVYVPCDVVVLCCYLITAPIS